MPTLDTYHGAYLWHYIPNLPAAITFAILFGLVTTAHGWKMVKTRMWFCLPFVIGGLFEEVGYISRAAATNDTGSLIPYILQAIFLLLPPVLFAASLYMVYSRLVRTLDAAPFSPIPPRWTTVIFVTADFTCLNIQSTGSSLLSKPKNAQIGEYIIVGGLGLQVVVFAGFVVVCGLFNFRFERYLRENGASGVEEAVRRETKWQANLNMLYATSAAVLVRNVYRVVEFIMGQDGYLQSTEWPTYVFDAALMLAVMVGFYVWYPSGLRPKERASDEEEEDVLELRGGATGDAESVNEGARGQKCSGHAS